MFFSTLFISLGSLVYFVISAGLLLYLFFRVHDFYLRGNSCAGGGGGGGCSAVVVVVVVVACSIIVASFRLIAQRDQKGGDANRERVAGSVAPEESIVCRGLVENTHTHTKRDIVLLCLKNGLARRRRGRDEMMRLVRIIKK